MVEAKKTKNVKLRKKKWGTGVGQTGMGGVHGVMGQGTPSQKWRKSGWRLNYYKEGQESKVTRVAFSHFRADSGNGAGSKYGEEVGGGRRARKAKRKAEKKGEKRRQMKNPQKKKRVKSSYTGGGKPKIWNWGRCVGKVPTKDWLDFDQESGDPPIGTPPTEKKGTARVSGKSPKESGSSPRTKERLNTSFQK